MAIGLIFYIQREFVMKTGLLWSLIIAAAPSYSFAAQAVDCDELAKHIKTELTEFRTVAIKSLFGKIMVMNWKNSEYCDSSMASCYDKIENLKYVSKKFETYQNALMRCTKTSINPCPLAISTIHRLQHEIDLASTCISAYTLAREKRMRFDSYIHESKKE